MAGGTKEYLESKDGRIRNLKIEQSKAKMREVPNMDNTNFIKIKIEGTSLVVQGLRLKAPSVAGPN